MLGTWRGRQWVELVEIAERNKADALRRMTLKIPRIVRGFMPTDRNVDKDDSLCILVLGMIDGSACQFSDYGTY